MKWCRSFQPDVIYSVAYDDVLSLWLPQLLSKLLGVPYVIQVWDDWPALLDIRTCTKWKGLVQLKKRLLLKLFESSSANFCVSDEMCEAYRQRYGYKFKTFHNCVDSNDWYVFAPRKRQQDFLLRYVGVVTQEKELQSLIDIRSVVVKLRRQGYPIKMEINSSIPYIQTIEDHLVSSPAVYFGGTPTRMELPGKLAESDVLLLAINFDDRSKAYAGYSFQTKVPEYMASGVPVLAYGPPDNPSIRYALSGGWAKVVDTNVKKRLESAILNLYENEGLRQRLSSKARQLARQEHEGAIIRSRFKKEIYSAIN